ncbi:DNA topoisomerase VI, B subunit [Methanolacinia petrolearia DSM 11571]|uniref:Type 2 DNA topoisomerase 6 subunit B n=1 Tax=Methanolacinia petrolearia (strain DSM 11571 / OCM 486 / SEBR 4847) TaxID=679926 RepID=E1RDT5_METP4|nr:DNA topoisomerase VI subunit B [Methanolacinia petrolearia]ADN37122.1 DNA topoisomerase VI, B subunit [Methanolacinia petrolearia DSM 11571]
MELAEQLAGQQKSISVAEFFEKNKHLLGFDSPTRGIITTIKEAVDNSLDACEEAEVLPDIFVGVKKVDKDVYRIIVEDNGPGIVPKQVPFVFGKLLYGSRFHQIKQSRGQQGIGISAAVLYAQLTTGVPAVVISRTSYKNKAHRFEIMIRTEANEPEVLKDEEIEWDRMHGTRIEIEFKTTLAAKKRLLDYLMYTSVVNPHARIKADIDGEVYNFERVNEETIVPPKAILPHPHGLELGQLKRIAAASDINLKDFLINSFSRVGDKNAEEIIGGSGLKESRKAKTLTNEELKKLLESMQNVEVPPPPASQCLSPIGEDMIIRGIDKEFQLDFVRARTRKSKVFSGHPFIVEAAIGYGGKLESEGTATILRFANRVPLLYQQGACAITNSIAGINWKAYNISQQGLPTGPVLILVHVASTNVPFTSESKDAVASIPEIEKEIVLALQDLGRDLKMFLGRRDRNKQFEERARAVCSILPDIAMKVSEIVKKPVPDISPLEGQIMKKVVAKKGVRDGFVEIMLSNYTNTAVSLTIYNMSPEDGKDASPKPDFVDNIGDEYNKLWKVIIEPDNMWSAKYKGTNGGTLDIRGVEEKKLVVIDLDN